MKNRESKNQERTNRYYKEAVNGLDQTILADRDLWFSYVTCLPLHLQVAYTIVVFHNQVFNGGFHQYFFNAYGQFAYLTLDNLRLIKAMQTAHILEETMIL